MTAQDLMTTIAEIITDMRRIEYDLTAPLPKGRGFPLHRTLPPRT